jgi:hypothetical protein
MRWLLLEGRPARTARGQVIVNLETDFPEARFIQVLGCSQVATRRWRSVVMTVRFQNGRPVVGIAGVETMNDAEALVTGTAKRWLAPLPDTFYNTIGCQVNAAGNRRVVEGSGTFRKPVAARRRPARHILLVLDICDDHTADDASSSTRRGLLALNQKS